MKTSTLLFAAYCFSFGCGYVALTIHYVAMMHFQSLGFPYQIPQRGSQKLMPKSSGTLPARSVKRSGKLESKALAKMFCWLWVCERSAAQPLLHRTRVIVKAPFWYLFLSCNNDCGEMPITAIDQRSVSSTFGRFCLLPGECFRPILQRDSSSTYGVCSRLYPLPHTPSRYVRRIPSDMNTLRASLCA
jgi:hypothetical protein